MTEEVPKDVKEKAQELMKLSEEEFERLKELTMASAGGTCNCSCPTGGAGAGQYISAKT